MTYRTATVDLLRRHAPDTPPAVLARIETGDEADAALLCDVAQEQLARRLPVGILVSDARDPDGRLYGCRVAVYAGGRGVEISGRCPFARQGGRQVHRSCKHTAAEVDRVLDDVLDDDLGLRLSWLTVRLRNLTGGGKLVYPPIVQPAQCGRCGDPVDGGECACGNAGNTITKRARQGADQPGGLNR